MKNLNEILKDHKLWLENKGGARANLEGANLRGANLRSANLRYADLRADLRYANLRYANLGRAELRYADLRDADLEGADLRSANLGSANLKGADLRYANLKGAYLKGANLRGANLDFSCFPLWCGGIGWEVDSSLPKMLSAFICSMKCDDEETKKIQEMLISYAQKSHRAEDILGES